MILISKVLTLCVLLPVTLSQTSNRTCGPSTKCLLINECNFIRDILGTQPPHFLRELVRPLLCDISKKGAYKVCCPPYSIPVNVKTRLPSLKECGIQTSNKIDGVNKTEIYEHPWLALIRYEKPTGWGFYCAGVLITSRHVLTAAHCLKGADLPQDWKISHVRLGEWNISSARDCIQISTNPIRYDCSDGILDVEVEQLISHAAYDKNDVHQQNDIALLKLARDVPFNDFIRPICLPSTKEEQTNLYVDYEMEVAGWGKTETKTMSEVKLKTQVPVVSRQKCAKVYEMAGRQITEKQICAGGKEGVDSCRGDTGGPLMTQIVGTPNWITVGVASYSPTHCGTANWPAVYTRVGYYIDWIKEHLS